MTLLWDISLKTSEDQIIKPLFACKTSKKQKTKKNKIRQLFRLGEIKQCATDFFLLSRLKFFSLQRVKGGGSDRGGVAE